MAGPPAASASREPRQRARSRLRFSIPEGFTPAQRPGRNPDVLRFVPVVVRRESSRRYRFGIFRGRSGIRVEGKSLPGPTSGRPLPRAQSNARKADANGLLSEIEYAHKMPGLRQCTGALHCRSAVYCLQFPLRTDLRLLLRTRADLPRAGSDQGKPDAGHS